MGRKSPMLFGPRKPWAEKARSSPTGPKKPWAEKARSQNFDTGSKLVNATQTPLTDVKMCKQTLQ